MFEPTLTIEPWHWWAIAALLIVIEIASPTFYFLWPGLAAAAMGALLLSMPDLDWRIQVVLFSALAVASTYLWKRYAPEAALESKDHELLNRRAAQYVGRRVIASVDFEGERGAVHVDDTRWTAVTTDGSNPKKGTALEIAAADGATLRVRATQSGAERNGPR